MCLGLADWQDRNCCHGNPSTHRHPSAIIEKKDNNLNCCSQETPQISTYLFSSTVENEGPGFLVNWLIDDDGSTSMLLVQFRRDSDTMNEVVGMDQQDFEESFGFGIWVHYIIAYRYGSGKYINNIEVYHNGEVHPKSSKYILTWWDANTADYNGNMELGVAYLGGTSLTANMCMDDLIIFEEEIPCDDAYRLYNAYNR